jgi:hypothetical protein
MKKRKGDLPGRYVRRHIRKAPNRPSEYVNVSDWQESVEPIPTPMESPLLQGELEFPITSNPDQKDAAEVNSQSK